MKKSIGFIGCSNIARKAMLPAVLKSDFFEVFGFVSRSNEKAMSYVSEFGGRVFSLEAILNSECDAIYVSNPVGLHHSVGKRVLESGKHLLMEKTFTESFPQCMELLDLAETRNLIAMESLMYQYHPLQRLIEDTLPRVGKIREVSAKFGFPHFDDFSDIRYDKSLGGGADLDSLIYPLSFCLAILGKDYIKVQGASFAHAETGINERGYYLLQYEDNVASIAYGFSHAYTNEIRIWGEQGILEAKRVFTRPEQSNFNLILSRDFSEEVIEVPDGDHFLETLRVFYDYTSGESLDKYKLECESLRTRIDLIDRIRNQEFA